MRIRKPRKKKWKSPVHRDCIDCGDNFNVPRGNGDPQQRCYPCRMKERDRKIAAARGRTEEDAERSAPSEDQIAVLTAEIRKDWTERDHIGRAGKNPDDGYTVPMVAESWFFPA